VPVVATVIAALALLPGFTQAPSTPGGAAVLTGTFPGEARPGYVYLPPGFDPAQRYSVVYLLHGMPGSPSEYLEGADLPDWADAAIQRGAVRPFIAVIPAAGADHRYNGEWAGPWENAVVTRLVPWVDAHLPTIAAPAGRVLAGLSAGGFGALDIGLRHPDVFGLLESWSGYFHPLHDGPFKDAPQALLDANDPTKLVRAKAGTLRAVGLRVFLSTGPAHSHWFTPAGTTAFASELRRLAIPVALRIYPTEQGVWRAQLADGLAWALGA
jgi:enterochelin esterase-like enzyme